MRLSYDYCKYIIVLNRKLTNDAFLSLAGAENGYAKDMFTRMYESIFSELIDLEREYQEYYAFEYNSFPKFLYQKYNVDPDDIKELVGIREQCADYGIFKGDDLTYGDSGVNQLAFSETMYDRIIDILLLKTIPS